MPIRIHAVAYVLGQFLLMMSVTMILPLSFAVFGQSDDPRPTLAGLAVTLAFGVTLTRSFRKPETDLTIREALFTVTTVWASVAFFGSLPFYFSPHFQSFTDAFFESTSGFTTTGATILGDVEVLPRSLQFWRHLSHWLGGMGIVMLGIAILPLIGAGGKTLYNAQFAVSPSENLKPRVLETAHALWRIYLLITAAEFIALRLAGMDSFDAICHTFSTLGTGGFSTRTASIAYYDSVAIELVIILFMVISSLNFATQYRMWAEYRPWAMWKDSEARFHICVLAGATLGVAVTLIYHSAYAAGTAIRQAAFQVTSIGTTTGFATANYEIWHPFAQLTLLVLMYFGGNTGSTAGGLKSFRIVLLIRLIGRTMTRIIEPRRVLLVRVGDSVIPDSSILSLLNLVVVALLFNFAASLALAATGLDLLSSFSAVPACMFSVGPALGSLGPAENYGHLPIAAKWILSITMLVGRVEFSTALVLLTRWFWRT